jgi:YARHG domain
MPTFPQPAKRVLAALLLLPAVGLTAATGMVVSGATPAAAQNYRSMTCRELWYERNRIYARSGYCFETRRARRVFGRGCFPPYGRLRRWERREVGRIERWEYRKDCR